MEHDIEELKDKLNQCIRIYGLNDVRTIEVSQQLDIPITIRQGELNAKS